MDFKIGSYCLVVLATVTLGTTTALDLDKFISNTRMDVVGVINGKVIIANITSEVRHLNCANFKLSTCGQKDCQFEELL